jgi:putative transcriptional regulator
MNSLKGHLLIATPELVAPLFARSVILMIDHDENGAMGVILNRPTDASVSDLAGKIFEEDFFWEKPLHLGGPVSGPLMVLHDLPDLADRQIVPGVSLTLEATKAQEIIRHRPEPCSILVNYSGWGAGQLEGEFGWNSWVTLPATAEHVFGWERDDYWEFLVRQVNVRKLSEFFGVREIPPDPSMN